MKRIILFMLLALCSGLAGAQQAGTSSIKERMSPEQFKAAGLNKLSDAELKQLNAWFNGEKIVVVEKTVIVEKPAEAGMAAPKQATDDQKPSGGRVQGLAWQYRVHPRERASLAAVGQQ
jgi:hypothetical protein